MISNIKRLSRVAREFNLSISTIVEFLHKKGFAIDTDPNNKISDEMYMLLEKEYKDDGRFIEDDDFVDDELIIKGNTSRNADHPQHNDLKASKHEHKEETFTTSRPEVGVQQVIGSIDLSNLNHYNKKEKQAGYSETKTTATNEPKYNEAKVVGRIDLDLLIQKTRLEKQSLDQKEEEYKDLKRIPKDRHQNSANQEKREMPKRSGQKINVNKNKDDNQQIQQQIWTTFIDVQEQMLRLRTAPVGIIPDSAKIVGEKLFITVNENDTTDAIIDELALAFNLSTSEIDLEAGHLLVDMNTAQNVTQDVKNQISERAASNFINFQPRPIIDGYLNKKESPIKNLLHQIGQSECDYTFDKKERLQITLENLRKLVDIASEGKANINIPETASIILPIRPSPVFFLSKEFPNVKFNHKTQWKRKRDKYINKDDRTISWKRIIEIFNGYLDEITLERLNKEIGFSLFGYEFTFIVNPNVISKHDPKLSPHILPKINVDNNSFTFHTKLQESPEENGDDMWSSDDEEKWDFNLKYTRLKKFFDSYFGSENVKFESKFLYTYDLYQFETKYIPNKEYSRSELLEYIYNSLFNDDFSISENIDSIGIDFNWKNEILEDVIVNLFNKCAYVNFGLFKNHRINIDFQINDISLDKAEILLRDNFPSINIKRDDKKGTLYFFQEYQNLEQRFRIRQILDSELKEWNRLNYNIFNYRLYDIPENKEKYIFEIDKWSKRESQASAVKELRGADFCVNKNYFGKLFRVNYPELIFDISGINYEMTKQLFESYIIRSIEPNLTGDLEKIYRLKNSLSNILSGANLQNPNLKDFIFNAEKAKKIEDIDVYINSKSDIFYELEYHLLNKKVNESQKKAIIKTLLTEDLALIQGPPGTGKSTAIAEIIWQHIRRNPKERILLTSETNLAVDNAIDRIVNSNHNLVKPIRFGEEEKLEMEGRQFSVDIMKRWVKNGTIEIDSEDQAEDEELTKQKLILLNWIENIKNRALKTNGLDIKTLSSWTEILSNPTREIRQIFYDNYIKNCNVIGATCSSIGERNTRNNPTSFFKSYCEIFGNLTKLINRNGSPYTDYNGKLAFSTVIQDESSKATPAELSLPLIYGKKNIIIGDHRQLPPMLDKEEFKLSLDFLLDRTENKEERRSIQRLKSFVLKHFDEMEISHFERLFERIDTSLKGIFNLQYRMHPDINDVIKQFYIQDGGLECGLTTPIDLGVNDPDISNSASRYHGINIEGLMSKDDHVIWVDTNTPELLDGTSRINYGEIDAIREILIKFRNSDSFKQYQSFWNNPEDQQIGLISFYGKQIKLLKNLRNDFRDIPIRVSTVDRFQGMERNIIIVSMVRSNRIASDKNQKADLNLYGNLGFPEQKELGFAQSPNRLNVALSRAKRLLIMVGNSELFRQKEIYNNVYKTIESKGGIRKFEKK